ncbi:MAG: MATE family efflux transporter, partial [Erysipelotrichaceae bacterium]|nr:MATE family efflux transporter [Erysipelotrichaceae bacterium]
MCYSAADMIIVGLSGVEGAIGSIGTTNAMINLILNTFMGFALGTTVVVARNIGKSDKTATENAVHTSLIVAVISGAVC